MLKTILIAGTVLGTVVFAVTGAALLGVMLGTRALVISSDAVRPAAPLSLAVEGQVISPEVRLAMRNVVAAGE